MNLIEHYVTKVLEPPTAAFGKWWVKVEADSYGRLGDSIIVSESLAAAREIKVGFMFLA